MKRLSKPILLCGGLVAAVVVTLLALNLYLQSSAAQAQIQEAISDAIELPVKIESTNISLFGALKINGIRIAQIDGSPGNFIEAESFTANYQLLPLFSKRLVVPHMTLDAPKMAWRQDSDGEWSWPSTKPKKPKSNEPKVKKPKEKKPKEKRLVGRSKSGFEVEIEDVSVRHGSLALLDAQGAPVISASGLNIDLDEFAPPDFAGRISAEKLGWSGLAFEQVATPFTFEDGTLDISDLNAQLGGGTAHITFKLETDERGEPVAAQLSLRKVEIAKLLAAAGQTDGFVSGQVTGDLELHGTMKKFARSEGSGRLQLDDGHFQKLELFETIGQVLGIEELTNLRFTDASIVLRMADEKIYVEPLMLATPDLQLSAKGSTRLDLKLNLEARLAVNDKIAQKLPGFVRDNFAATASDPLKGIDFKVTGTADKPKTDLAEKLIGKKVGEQVSDLIGGLFGTKKNKKDDADDPPKDSKEPKEKKKKKGDKPAEPDKPASAEPAPAGEAPVSKLEPAVPPAKEPAQEPAKEPAPQP